MAQPAAGEINDQSIVIKMLEKVPYFSGSSNEDVTSFVDYIDYVHGHLTPTNMVLGTLIIKNKLQGAAINTLQRILSPTWETIKTALIQDYGIPETYEQILQDLHRISTRDIHQLYHQCEEILNKINKKSKLELSLVYVPLNNESIILNKFINNLNSNQASVIIAQNIKTLREAYQVLLRYKNLNLSTNDSSKNYQTHYQKPFSSNQPHKPYFNQQNNNFSRNQMPNSLQRKFRNEQVLGKPQGNFRFGFQNHQPFRNNYNNNYPRQNSQQHRNPRPEPMDVNTTELNQEEVNFILVRKPKHFP